LRQLINFGMHLWMYATPVVYPMSQLSTKWQLVMRLNPVSAPIEYFRSIAFGVHLPEISFMIMSILATIVLFCIGLLLFHRNETTFVDVV